MPPPSPLDPDAGLHRYAARAPDMHAAHEADTLAGHEASSPRRRGPTPSGEDTGLIDDERTSRADPATRPAPRVADALGSTGPAPDRNALPSPHPEAAENASATGPARVSDARDSAGAIWHDGAFHRDAWTKAADGAALTDTPAIVSRKRWLSERDALVRRNAPLGLQLDGGERIDDLAGDLARFSLIALAFPKFSDGRAFSTARLLRDKHGYTGELRAIGNVLSDQIPLMRRVGFDSLEVVHAPTRRALEQGRLAEVTLHYQPARADEPPAGTRPWLRRTAR